MNMNKIKLNHFKLLAVLLITSSFILTSCTEKSHEKKVFRVGILSGLDVILPVAENFIEEMSARGYIEGMNIIYDLQKTNFEPDKEKLILEKFINDKVDLILVFPTQVAVLAKQVTEGTGIPIVFANANIEGTGLIESVTKPGGDITGVRWPGHDITIKRFEVMMDLVPDIKRIWIPYRKGSVSDAELDALKPVAEEKGVELIKFSTDNAADIKAELDKMAESGNVNIDAILHIVGPLSSMSDAFLVISNFSIENKVPFGGVLSSRLNYEGALFSIIVDVGYEGMQAAYLANKILRGIPAGTIPVLSAENYIIVNYKYAQELGIEVSEGFLAMADEIIR